MASLEVLVKVKTIEVIRHPNPGVEAKRKRALAFDNLAKRINQWLRPALKKAVSKLSSEPVAPDLIQFDCSSIASAIFEILGLQNGKALLEKIRDILDPTFLQRHEEAIDNLSPDEECLIRKAIEEVRGAMKTVDDLIEYQKKQEKEKEKEKEKQ